MELAEKNTPWDLYKENVALKNKNRRLELENKMLTGVLLKTSLKQDPYRLHSNGKTTTRGKKLAAFMAKLGMMELW